MNRAFLVSCAEALVETDRVLVPHWSLPLQLPHTPQAAPIRHSVDEQAPDMATPVRPHYEQAVKRPELAATPRREVCRQPGIAQRIVVIERDEDLDTAGSARLVKTIQDLCDRAPKDAFSYAA